MVAQQDVLTAGDARARANKECVMRQTVLRQELGVGHLAWTCLTDPAAGERRAHYIP